MSIRELNDHPTPAEGRREAMQTWFAQAKGPTIAEMRHGANCCCTLARRHVREAAAAAWPGTRGPTPVVGAGHRGA